MLKNETRRINRMSPLISLMLCLILISPIHAFTTVEVAKKALPAVVGIAIPKQLFGLYGFSGGGENQRIKDFLKEYSRELERFKKQAKPAQKPEKARSVKPEDLQVVGSGFFHQERRNHSHSGSCC